MRYDYTCNVCGEKFEEFRKVDDRDNAVHCGKKSDRLISGGASVLVDASLKDSKGTPIWFPKDGRSYRDKALGLTFHSKRQKQQYLKDKGYICDGSHDKSSQKVMSRKIK